VQQQPAALLAFGAFLVAPGGGLRTHWNPSAEVGEQREAVTLRVSWEDLQGEQLQL